MEEWSEDLRRVLGDAFAREGAVQCGFCIPGIVMRALPIVKQESARSRGSGQSNGGPHLPLHRLDAYSWMRFRPRGEA